MTAPYMHAGMEEVPLDQPTGKSVLLFSGGLDSIIYNYLLKPDVCLFVDMSHRSNVKERLAIRELTKCGAVKRVAKAYLPISPPLHAARADHIIPLRNLHLLAAAARYGESLYFGRVRGSYSYDKSDDFFAKVSELLRHCYDDTWWSTPRDIHVAAPFSSFYKSQLVAKYLAIGGDPKHLLLASACYESIHTDISCGRCLLCIRRRIALEANGIECRHVFTHTVQLKQSAWDQILAGDYESEDTLGAWN